MPAATLGRVGSRDKEVHEGQAIYNRLVLSIYDLLVVNASCRLAWRCPNHHMLRMYSDHVGAAHLDLGVGTGFYLDKCRFPVSRPRITLVDLNDNSLAHTAGRIARYDVTRHRANVLEPLDLPADEFDSAALNFLLHCLPGSMAEKAVSLDHAAACVRPGGVVFGSTILSQGVPVSGLARWLMARYNASGIFHNTQDSLDGLRAELGKRFSTWNVDVHGNIALFTATVD